MKECKLLHEIDLSYNFCEIDLRRITEFLREIDYGWSKGKDYSREKYFVKTFYVFTFYLALHYHIIDFTEFLSKQITPTFSIKVCIDIIFLREINFKCIYLLLCTAQWFHEIFFKQMWIERTCGFTWNQLWIH